MRECDHMSKVTEDGAAPGVVGRCEECQRFRGHDRDGTSVCLCQSFDDPCVFAPKGAEE